LTEYCLEALGLHKTFLVLSMTTLMTLPVSLLLSPNKSEEKKFQHENLKHIFRISPVYLTNFRIMKKYDSNCLPNEDSCYQKNKIESNSTFSFKSTFDQAYQKVIKLAYSLKQIISKQDDIITSAFNNDQRSNARKQTDKILSILINSHFILICATHLTYFWGVLTYTMIIVDHAVDKGMIT